MVTTTTTTENHKIVVMEHELVVDGVSLSERKQLTTVTSDDPCVSPKSILVHTRTIGDRSYEVREVKVDGVTTDTAINTTLSDKEVQQFQADWLDLWCPTISDEQIANNQAAESQNPLPVAKQVENEEEPQLPVEVPDLPVEDDDDEDEAPENEVPDAVPEDFQQPTTTEFPAESIPNDPKAEF